MYKTLRELLSGTEFSVLESFEIPSRPALYGEIPPFLFDSKIGPYLTSREFRLWAHQAQALDTLGHGDNVVISTGTASGKSLVFRTLTLHKTLCDPSSRTLVFYPLKALVADQIRGWQEMAHALGLSEDIIGRIDGSVQVNERDDILRHARIVVMTPDVCHAWLMSRLATPDIKNFVRELSTLVMDEAHTLEGVFGSNFAFLVRRLIAVRNRLLDNEANAHPLQIVAATATIANPAEHLKELTGSEFSVINHEADGAPQHERIVAHVASARDKESLIVKKLQRRVLTEGRDGGFITFVDSRKGVETLAIASQQEEDGLSDDPAVLPYRAGYDNEDRQRIEERLQLGSLRGIVSTSALELGIDLPHLRVGFNVGVPATRKAYRQRLGRVGRSGAGAFIVIAPLDAFLRYGTSFRDYHEMSVEQSYLYLDNRFMQFAHGRCLADELDALGTPASVPTHIRWPAGFRKIYQAARPGGDRPPEFDVIAELGGDTPQYSYPLRSTGEVNLQIKRHENSESFGELNQTQALREAYPGATYLHMAKAYEVAAWHTHTPEPFILVKPGSSARSTQPRIKTWINTGITSSELIDGRLLRSENGFLAECQMQITERVEGFVDGSGQFHSYQDLRPHNPAMRARLRNFRTSGVVLCIEQDWFKKESMKSLFSDRWREVFMREYSVLPQDVGSAATNISVRTLEGGGLRGGCVAVFDQTYGSLRITERLYVEFTHILDRLSVAATANSEQNLELIIARIREEFSDFSASPFTEGTSEELSEGYDQVFTKGSRVCMREQGQMAVDVEIIQPTMMEGRLMYQVKIPPKPKQSQPRRWVSASVLEPSGDASSWDYASWNRQTEEYEDPPDDTES